MPSRPLLIDGAHRLVTMDDGRRVLADGWLSARDGLITAVGSGPVPAAPGGVPRDEHEVIPAGGCVVLPGLVNTHHHLYQTRTRAHPDAVDSELFPWLQTLYPVWSELRDEDFRRAARVGCRELLRSGCTLTADHHYLFPADASPHLLDIVIEAALETGIRLHATRGSMSRSRKDGGLPPDSVVQTADAILADSRRVVERWHDPAPGAAVRLALAPCSPFSIDPGLMRETAALARGLGVRLHTHLAETEDENAYCERIYGQRPLDFLASVDWLGPDVWLAHGIWFEDGEIARLGAAGTGIAHCPSSNMRLGSGICPVRKLRAAGCPVGLAVDGSASNDSSHMLAELRQALLLHRVLDGAAAMTVGEVLEMATRDGAACLGREDAGVLEPGRVCDVAMFDLEAIGYDGAEDPVAALLLCHPEPARTVVVGGRVAYDRDRDGSFAVPR